MKTLSPLLSLVLSLSCGLTFAQSEPVVDSPSTASEKVADRSQVAVAKSLVLFAMAMDAKKEQQADQLSQCVSFALEEAAPSAFVDIMQAMTQQEDGEALAQSVANLGTLVQEYKIDISYLDLWRKSYLLKFPQMRTLLKGDLGDALLRAEALTPINEESLAALPTEERLRQASAIKAALLMLYIYNKEDSKLVTTQQRVQCAEMASHMGAPPMFARLLLSEMNSELSPRTRYDLRQALQKMLAAYRIDRIGLRLLGERYELGSQIADQLIAENKIPFPFIFNLDPDMPDDCSASEANEIAMGWAEDLKKMATLLRLMESTTDQEAALLELYSYMPSFFRIIDLFHRGDMNFSQKLSKESFESMKLAREELVEELRVAYNQKEHLSPEFVTFLNLFK